MGNEVSKYVSMDRIFSKLNRDLGIDPSMERDIVEWAGEALEAIGAITMYEEAVAFIEVKNHQAQIPNGTHAIIQIARNTCYDEVKKCGLCPSDIVQEMEEESHTPIVIDCNGSPLEDYDLAYYRPYFDLRDETGYWTQRYTSQCFQAVRLANHTFFNSLVCRSSDEGDDTPYHSYIDEYTVVEGDTLRFSFREGQIALSYVRQKLDDKGYPMIPEHYAYQTAVTKYVTYRMMERKFYSGEQGAGAMIQKAEADWHFYCKQARNRSLMPKGVDAWQNIMEQRQYMLPRIRRYYGFFGKMSRPESRKFNDPDNRNYSTYFRRGQNIF